MEMPCPCLGTSTTEREEKIGVLIWDILPPVHLLTPDCGPLPASIYDLYNQVILCHPLLLLPSIFPRVFSDELTLNQAAKELELQF